MTQLRNRVTADDLDFVLWQTLDALTKLDDLDWSAPAGRLRWSCLTTAGHMADCCLAYAGQLVALPADHYVEFRTRLTRAATPIDALEFLDTMGRLFSIVVRQAAREVRAFHPFGLTDPSGFTALGGLEPYVHAWDICEGLHSTFVADREECVKLLDRLFSSRVNRNAPDPWQELLYLTGRRSSTDGRRMIRSPRWDPSVRV